MLLQTLITATLLTITPASQVLPPTRETSCALLKENLNTLREEIIWRLKASRKPELAQQAAHAQPADLLDLLEKAGLGLSAQFYNPQLRAYQESLSKTCPSPLPPTRPLRVDRAEHR